MATKEIKWVGETKAEIKILDGQAVGTYQLDIESYENTPCGGLITIGEIIINSKRTKIRVRVEDIPEYWGRYDRTPKALRAKRENLILDINGILDETKYKRDKWFEDEGHRGNLPEYDSPEYRAAEQALEDFDIEHPEIIQGIEKEREESIEHHLWD